MRAAKRGFPVVPHPFDRFNAKRKDTKVISTLLTRARKSALLATHIRTLCLNPHLPPAPLADQTRRCFLVKVILMLVFTVAANDVADVHS